MSRAQINLLDEIIVDNFAENTCDACIRSWLLAKARKELKEK